MKLVRYACIYFSSILAASLVTGCNTPDPHAIDYQSQTKPKVTALTQPPDITEEKTQPDWVAPTGTVALSSYSYQRNETSRRVKNVLAPVPGMHIQREGIVRWLVVDNKAPEQLWDPIRRFWQQEGFVLVDNVRTSEIIETDWKETHSSIKQGLIRNTLSKVLGPSSYMTAERNKYRTRVEAGPEGNSYIFIRQTGMHEVLIGQSKETSRWETSPNHPELEAEYLQRLMHALAAYAKSAQQQEQVQVPSQKMQKTPQSTITAATTPSPVVKPSMPQMPETPVNHLTQVNLNEPFERAWLRVGLALNRSNFTVDDQDYARGLYMVRYVDPNDRSAAQQGFWHQIFHGKKEKVAQPYRVNVRAITETMTRVAMINEAGEIDLSTPAQHILLLLAHQLD